MRKIGNRFAAAVLHDGRHPDQVEAVIVKLSNREVLPESEPLFLIRARDRLAVPLLRLFRQLMVDDNCNDYILGLTDQMIDEFEKFRREHPEKMKQPGVTRGE